MTEPQYPPSWTRPQDRVSPAAIQAEKPSATPDAHGDDEERGNRQLDYLHRRNGTPELSPLSNSHPFAV